MRERIALAVLVFFATCAFAAPKNVKQLPSSTGIVITSSFGFYIQGDGISTTFNLTPWSIPQGGGSPNIPLFHLWV